MKSLTAAELDLVGLSGETVVQFCQGQLSCDVEALKSSEIIPGLLLDPQGKLVSTLRIRKVSDRAIELYVEPGFGSAVAEALERFNLGSKIKIDLDVVPVMRYRAMKGSEETPPGSEYLEEFWGSDWIAHDYLESDLDTYGVYEDCRIAAGAVEMGTEIFAGDIPASAPIVSGFVSFDKGCYLGQELVARMNSRKASPPQRIVRVHGESLVAGSEILNGDENVGKVLSVAGDPEIGGLAILKRKADLGDYITSSSASVTVSELEFDIGKA